jgi:alkylresorcinol/alkylpyrone synthase
VGLTSGTDRRRGGLRVPGPVTPVEPRARRTGPTLAGVAVADSLTVLSQAQVLDRLGLADSEFAAGIFERCGVERRHLDLGPDLLERTPQGRTAQVEEQLLLRSIEAVDALEIDPAQIGTVLSASLYSLGCPTLAHRLVDHYRMDPATDKYHVTGVGCASAVPLMRLAAQSLREHPDRQALIVAAESMSGILTPSMPGDPKAKVIGSAIFGDGCAAALLSNDPRCDGPAIVASQVHQIGETLDAVSLEFAQSDGYLHLARELPDLAAAGLPGVVEGFLQGNRLAQSDIDHWIMHPGGRRIIENMQAALGLSHEQVELSWDVLANHGNVGTPAILYVLDATVARRRPARGERALMVTIGPGVTVGLMLLAW